MGLAMTTPSDENTGGIQCVINGIGCPGCSSHNDGGGGGGAGSVLVVASTISGVGGGAGIGGGGGEEERARHDSNDVSKGISAFSVVKEAEEESCSNGEGTDGGIVRGTSKRSSRKSLL